MRLLNTTYNGAVPNYGTAPYNQMNMMGGYYNNQYNPWYYQQQRQIQEEENRRRLEEIQNQNNTMNMMNSIYGQYTGQEIIMPEVKPITYEEHVKRQQEVNTLYQSHRISENLRSRAMNKDYVCARRQAIMQHIDNAEKDPTIKIQRECDSLYQFFQRSGEMILRKKETEERVNDLSRAYNRNDYRSLLRLHESSYDSLSRNMTIDDMEVTLPERIRNDVSYREARRRFLNSISNPPGR